MLSHLLIYVMSFFTRKRHMQSVWQTAGQNLQTLHSIHSAKTLLKFIHLLESYDSYGLYNRPSSTGLPKHDLTKKASYYT